MSSRDSYLKSLRPDILTKTIKTEMSSEEYFQNTVLRPIIKFQNDLLIAVFLQFCTKYKNVFFDLSTEKKILYIESSITKDSKLRSSFRDLIIGLFSVEEYSEYLKNASALNKRMTGIIKERLISHVQLLSESAPTK
ncbi:glyoxalase [Flavobacteriaceae bacterium]|nr:glyoxalase [Flavobacteriaceae bacterium]|tara:strand:- start:1276 stop:1686 length:411 start_codon:yes stop_codon:yes gene_type:complete